MTDKIDQNLLNIFSQLPGCWGCKDNDSIFVFANQEYGKIIGVDHHLDCIGRSDFDMPSPTAECAEAFRVQDQQVMDSGKRMKILDIHPYSDGNWRAHLFTKTPWKNEDNKTVGTIFSGIELKDTAILEVGHWICRAAGLDPRQQASFNLDLNQSNIILNTRESEVLFLLLYGKKPQYIARVLNVSVKTVENYVLKLREKFHANSKNELIDLALDNGFGSHIPESMLTRQLSVILKE
ncbi:helix-turn-helix transcriptional regulator [Photobacterium jeanii]|uniref:Helix-turn-helix transcriptional regulator n=1 Tax=Photobacterium jeanii TaxID=858640 RepID=A0A178K1G0_9GAMM|nr:helix-turn-helix transcriptional regulator [Photobacterium jeanii]OAN10937.1 helix-turn-helix transcriptional regulator [Photobacterium jeanii]PST90453.1 LuxR family transcriptional regulator [Photobacterium jeanii]